MFTRPLSTLTLRSATKGVRYASTKAATAAPMAPSKVRFVGAALAAVGGIAYVGAQPNKLHLEQEIRTTIHYPKRVPWHVRVGQARAESIKVAFQEPEQEEESKENVSSLLDEATSILSSKDEPLAFDSESGKINWDSPALASKASGPCGESFKSAFQCFTASEAEPKGTDCLESFKATQNCVLQQRAAAEE